MSAACLTVLLTSVHENKKFVLSSCVSNRHNLHDNMSVLCIPPYTPLLYSKTGVYRGLHYFLIFALKHRLWVLVRTASPRRFKHEPTINVLSKKKEKNLTIFRLKIIIFTAVKNCNVLHGHIFLIVK